MNFEFRGYSKVGPEGASLRGKYAEIREKIGKLRPGEWAKVYCANADVATAIRQNAMYGKDTGLVSRFVVNGVDGTGILWIGAPAEDTEA